MKKLGLLLACMIQFSCYGQVYKKINGVSFVASREEVAQEQVEAVMQVNSNSAAVMPFGFIREVNNPKISFNTDRQWFGETKNGAKQYIDMLHKNGISVMLKPQIWISKGVFTGVLKMDSEAHWKQLEESYSDFIMTFAQLAKESKVDVLCIGTELEQFVKNRPAYWNTLIPKIRQVYKGKLTYTANWDEFDRVPFWKQLDYIGIDAYFPLSESKTPTVEELVSGWQPWKTKMLDLSTETQKQILFTEYGYRSMDYSAKKPWLVDRTEEKPNMVSQMNCKKAIFAEFWGEKWFAGGYVWKWFANHDTAGGENDNRFTPQNKPSLKIISENYKKYSE
ncbi:glycoside hydrolase family 113 [Maribacter sp. ACAM166]|uniref:glycoside hydrolase family 113 n=1 Tax=Maribacter sp. ACAM166 TaxID=2508996 RepID=UPI0010FE8CA9|nr:glycoside hydrolase [Maribacter sp. ACAM166]TLP82739.1 glycoside hydrolase [Maribacter sp. ACAM166]